MRCLATLALLALLLRPTCLFADVPAATTAPASTAPATTGLFDPARHMRVSEVTPGMKGYGLSVFKGTKIERFNVEVLSVLRDFNPQYDVILVRLSGADLEHTGSIAGMSGSPVYLRDADGRERMVGAFAYGWPLMKDPVGGVQPIEYMLKLQHREHPSTTRPAALPTTQVSDRGTSTWNVAESFVGFDAMVARARAGVDDDNVTRMRPLATPLMTAGLSPRILEQLTPLMKAYGMVPLQAGGSGGGGSRNPVDAKLEPGSVLAVPLLTGDVEMTAVGTCTEVLGGRVFGFGHPFNNEGPIALPVGGGEIHGVIANLMTSFKLGALGKTWGTLDADEQVGVAGQLGVPPPMIPIDLDVQYTDGSGGRKYHFDAAWHTRFTPLLSAAALTAAVTGVHDLPEFHTLDYDITVEFANGETVHLANDLVNASMPELFFEVGVPMIAAAQNPFERVSVRKVNGKVKITPEAHEATILWVNAPRLKFRPG